MSAPEHPQKRCTNCGGPGPFGRRKEAKDGLKSECKECCAKKQRAYTAANRHVWANWAAANADRLKAKDAARYAADREGEKARVTAYKAANPEKRDYWQAKSNLARYGITPEEKQALFDKQGGKCAICSDPLTTGRKGMHIDHDHTTDALRGLLCALCNVMLGHFREDVRLLEAAVAYLGRGPLVGLTPKERPAEAGKAGTRASNLWYKYGLTEATLLEIRARQGGGCGICREPLNADAHIDHDHAFDPKTGLRGLLCRECNLGLGQARDDLRVLRGAVEYLRHRRAAA